MATNLTPVQNTFDLAPLYDPIVKSNNKLSDVWLVYIAALIDNLNSYLSQFGLFVPQLTQTQINAIQSPVNGQMLYNTSSDTMQYYKSSSGTWHSF